ncbi:conserved hypothetical protein [Pyrobaculum islandicum DSM 4184]|uniref:Uncharacterized protein n=2 Tax=Pyrobaculum islandicum TaxID=2277 RepID=A1RRA7_PYRIL|nr:conserved hypothetical protein [Pyrobaculum islandicum DSM 4184]
MWHVIGKSDESAFFKATLDLVLSTRIALFLSGALFILGVSTAGHMQQLHGYLMIAGLLAFYHAVMYMQLPGFINATPRRVVTWLLLALFFLGLIGYISFGYLAYLPYSLLHIVLYLRGLWGKPTYYPNVITAAGLFLLPLSTSHLDAVFSFPLASVYSLLYRIELSRARKRFTAPSALLLTALYLAAYVATKVGLSWAMALPSLALTLYARPRLNDAYGIGAFFFRWAIALAPLGAHFVYMAFAVVMSALCVPYFIPAILYRQVPNYKWELVATAAVAFLLRNIEVMWASALLTIALVIYVAVRSLREKYYPPL